MDAFCQAYGSVDSGGDDNTQDDTSESMGTTTPQSIIRAEACTPQEKRMHGKRKCNLIMTEVEADAGKEAKCIFFTMGPKKQKCGIPLHPSYQASFASADVSGDWLDVTKEGAPWFHDALKKIQSTCNPDKRTNVFQNLHDDLKLLIN